MHIAALVVATLGVFTDIAEVALGNTFSAVLAGPPFQISRAELSLLLAAVCAGGAAGAPLLGALADRYGRKLAMQTALLVLCVSSTAVAFSHDLTTMTLLRVVSGLALGGYPPLMLTSLTLLGFVFNLCGTLFGAVLSIYGAELVTTHLRAASASGCGRLVSALAPMVLLALLQFEGQLATFALISAALLVAIALIVVVGPPGREGLPVA